MSRPIALLLAGALLAVAGCDDEAEPRGGPTVECGAEGGFRGVYGDGGLQVFTLDQEGPRGTVEIAGHEPIEVAATTRICADGDTTSASIDKVSVPGGTVVVINYGSALLRVGELHAASAHLTLAHESRGGIDVASGEVDTLGVTVDRQAGEFGQLGYGGKAKSVSIAPNGPAIVSIAEVCGGSLSLTEEHGGSGGFVTVQRGSVTRLDARIGGSASLDYRGRVTDRTAIALLAPSSDSEVDVADPGPDAVVVGPDPWTRDNVTFGGRSPALCT